MGETSKVSYILTYFFKLFQIINYKIILVSTCLYEREYDTAKNV